MAPTPRRHLKVYSRHPQTRMGLQVVAGFELNLKLTHGQITQAAILLPRGIQLCLIYRREVREQN